MLPKNSLLSWDQICQYISIIIHFLVWIRSFILPLLILTVIIERKTDSLIKNYRYDIFSLALLCIWEILMDAVARSSKNYWMYKSFSKNIIMVFVKLFLSSIASSISQLEGSLLFFLNSCFWKVKLGFVEMTLFIKCLYITRRFVKLKSISFWFSCWNEGEKTVSTLIFC